MKYSLTLLGTIFGIIVLSVSQALSCAVTKEQLRDYLLGVYGKENYVFFKDWIGVKKVLLNDQELCGALTISKSGLVATLSKTFNKTSKSSYHVFWGPKCFKASNNGSKKIDFITSPKNKRDFTKKQNIKNT